MNMLERSETRYFRSVSEIQKLNCITKNIFFQVLLHIVQLKAVQKLYNLRIKLFPNELLHEL